MYCLEVSEVHRHIALLDAGHQVPQETRGFDEERVETFSLRSKEDAPDYRYMPDSNLPPLLLTQVSPVDILPCPIKSINVAIRTISPLLQPRCQNCHPPYMRDSNLSTVSLPEMQRY